MPMCHYCVPAERWSASGSGGEGHHHPRPWGRTDLYPLISAVLYCKCWTGQRGNPGGGGEGGVMCLRLSGGEGGGACVHVCAD